MIIGSEIESGSSCLRVGAGSGASDSADVASSGTGAGFI